MLFGGGMIEVLTGAGELTQGDGLAEVKDETGLYRAWKSLIQSLEESEAAVDEEGGVVTTQQRSLILILNPAETRQARSSKMQVY